MAKARSIGLLQVHDKRSGHQYRYYVSNIKDYVIENNSDSNVDDSAIGLDPEKDPLFQLTILNDMISHESMSFHHINIKSNLKDNDDYSRLNWT